jgi:SHS2 domain-containing protein
MGYELLPHTADLRACLTAPDLAGLYQSGADLVREVLVGTSAVEAADERTLELEPAEASGGEAEEERFFRFVRELLFLYDAEGFLPCRVAGLDPLTVTGERFDPHRHASWRQVKALTRHGYVFEKTPEGYRADVLFDL